MKSFKQLLEGFREKRLKTHSDDSSEVDKVTSHEARVRAFLKAKEEKKKPAEPRVIPEEDPLYGTPEDPRLDITREYKTSDDPLMMRAMTSGSDLSYMGLRGYKGKSKFSTEELKQRQIESRKRARAKAKEQNRQETLKGHVELRTTPYRLTYTDAATGELRNHWPPHEPWIHPWDPGTVINNFVPLRDDEYVSQADPPRYKYPSVFSIRGGRTR